MIPAKFITDLEVKELTDTKWELIQPLIFHSTALGLIIVPRGFITDFASVPRIGWVYAYAGDTAHKPAVIHDFLYNQHYCPRMVADAIFREAMKVDRQPWLRRTLMWAMVRLFGSIAYSHERRQHETEQRLDHDDGESGPTGGVPAAGGGPDDQGGASHRTHPARRLEDGGGESGDGEGIRHDH